MRSATLGKKKPEAEGAMGILRSDHERVLADRSRDALRFYVNAILLLRKNLELPMDGPLFHNSHRSGADANVCDFWVCGMSALERTAHQLLDERLGAKSSKIEILIGEMQGLRGSDDAGDVDAFLFLLMRHWAAAVLDREAKARDAAATDAVVLGGARAALQSAKAFDLARTSLKIAEPTPAVAPSSKEDTVGAMNFKRDLLRAAKRDLVHARAYGGSLLGVEGGVGMKKDVADACCDGLREVSFADMKATWVPERITPDPNSVHFDVRNMTFLYLSFWKAYHDPIETFLDAFEVKFTRGHDRDIEDARAQLIMLKRSVEKFNEENERPTSQTTVLKLHLFNERWAQMRALLDTINRLRGIEVDHTTKQIKDGHVQPADVDKDLVAVQGWGASYEFIRDSWTVGSKGRSFPQPRKQKAEHKLTSRGNR